MSSSVFAFDVTATLLLSGWLLFHYGDWMRHRVAVTVAVLIAWYFSFLIIFVLPLDVSSTSYKQCQAAEAEMINRTLKTLNVDPDPSSDPGPGPGPGPDSSADDGNGTSSGESVSSGEMAGMAASAAPPVASALSIASPCSPPYSLLPDHVLLNLWRVVYWSSQLLTWLILPLMQSYTTAGEFTVSGKLRSALWDNAVYYASYLFIALVLVVYIALQPGLHLDWEKIKAIAAAASNTWGLFVLVFMLGYGLVEVPRNCWHCTQRGYQLNRAYFKARSFQMPTSGWRIFNSGCLYEYFQIAKLMSERSDAEESLDDALSAAHAASEAVPPLDPRRPMVETVLAKIPLELLERARRRGRSSAAFDADPATTEKALVGLHRAVIRALQTHHRTEAQWADMINRCRGANSFFEFDTARL